MRCELVIPAARNAKSGEGIGRALCVRCVWRGVVRSEALVRFLQLLALLLRGVREVRAVKRVRGVIG